MAEQGTLQKFDLDKTEVLINGRQTVTIESLEWEKDFKDNDTWRAGEVVSEASAVESKKGKITLEQCEKLLIAEELGSDDGTLTGLKCDITGVDNQGRKIAIKRLRYGKDGYKIDKKAGDDKTTIDFTILGNGSYHGVQPDDYSKQV